MTNKQRYLNSKGAAQEAKEYYESTLMQTIIAKEKRDWRIKKKAISKNDSKSDWLTIPPGRSKNSKKRYGQLKSIEAAQAAAYRKESKRTAVRGRF